MAWARIDDTFHDHPKVDELSLGAIGLWTLCLTWAHRHRKTAIVAGHVTEARVRKVAGKQGAALTAELVAARLWDVEENLGGWVIHDFVDYLPKQRDPDERREAGRKGAANRWQQARQDDGNPDSNLPQDSMASDSSRASAPASPTRPVPEDQDLGGERPETLPASSATKRPRPAEPPRPPGDRYRCTAHQGVAEPPPCAGCKAARERAEREDSAVEERVREQQQRELETRRRACADCEGTGKVLDPNTKLPTLRRCEHRRVAS